jgi:lysozyme
MTQGEIAQGVMAVPHAAIDLAKRFEGFHRVPQSDPLRRAHPYVCPAGYWTIGWGHLCPPDHPPVTEAEAESYLAADMAAALTATALLPGAAQPTRKPPCSHGGLHL